MTSDDATMKLQNWLQCPDCGSEDVEYHFGDGRLALICDGECGQMQSLTMEKEHPFTDDEGRQCPNCGSTDISTEYPAGRGEKPSQECQDCGCRFASPEVEARD